MRFFLIATLVTLSSPAVQLVGQDRGAPAGPAKSSAAIDLTGYWVAFVTEDWRFRMITPHKGDYQGVPMTAQARKVADAWDPAADEASGNQCKAYGAAAIMRVPARFHITWQDDNTLRVDSDAGMQTRLFHFISQPPSPGEKTWQGDSTAQWDKPASLKVVTTNLRAGYLRKNGVPYSENASVTEYFDIAPLPGSGQALLVTTIVDDPQYLQQPFIVSSQFKKEADGSKWDPTPCAAK
ncbi:MAG TPA: hypothetical protein VN841_30290 [Bryobacteraceae bacterium]|nr:hypothetical protein [Bryobacteraceae bacterium]